MSTLSTLSVKHTATFQGAPLVCFSDLPGPDAELTPAQIRALAATLLTIAEDCEAHARGIRRALDVRRDYPIGA